MKQLQISLQSMARELRIFAKKIEVISGKLHIAPAKAAPVKASAPKKTRAQKRKLLE